MKPEIEKIKDSHDTVERDPLSLFRTYQKYVFSIALNMTKNFDLAQDITQEVFIKFLESKAQIPPNCQKKDIQNILRRVCINHTLNVIKKNKTRSCHEKATLKTHKTWSNPVDNILENQLLHQHLDKLDDKFRLPLRMRFFEDQKFGTIAKTLRVPITTVQSRVHKGLHLLQHSLKKEGFVVALPALENQLSHLVGNSIDLATAFYQKTSHTHGLLTKSELFLGKGLRLNRLKNILGNNGHWGLAKSSLLSASLISSALLTLAGVTAVSMKYQPEILTGVMEEIQADSSYLDHHIKGSSRYRHNRENKQSQKSEVRQELSPHIDEMNLHHNTNETTIAHPKDQSLAQLKGDLEDIEPDKYFQIQSKLLPPYEEENLKETNSSEDLSKKKEDEQDLEEKSQPVDQLPVALAGPDQNLLDNDDDGQELVELDGSGSYDPHKKDLTHIWLLGGEFIALGATTTVTLPLGVHEIVLWVSDADNSERSAYDSMLVTVSPHDNNFPVAFPRFFVEESDSTGQSILLDASASFDPDHDLLTTYTWNEVTNPPRSKLLYKGPSPTFLAQFEEGFHTLELIVTDNGLPPLSGRATLSLTIENTKDEPPVGLPPVASANFPPIVIADGPSGQGRVDVDASASSDPDGLIIFYEMFLVTDSGHELLWSDTAPTGEILLDQGTHQIKLCVTDNDEMQAEAIYSLTVTLGSPPTAQIEVSIEPKLTQPFIIYAISTERFLDLDASGSSDPDGGFLEYAWQYKLAQDDQWTVGGTGPTYSFSPLKPKAYHVRVQVKDEQGNISDDQINVLGE